MRRTDRDIPSKQTLNLAMRERSINSPSRILPIAAVLTALVLLFAKFAVVDRLLAVSRVQDQANALDSQLTQIAAENQDYDAVLEEYMRYSSGWMSETEAALVDRNAVFSLLESDVLPMGGLKDLSMTGNTLSLDLTGLSLQDASDILTRLKAREDVLSVSVDTAGTTDDGTLESVSMVITMTNGRDLPDEEGGGAR